MRVIPSLDIRAGRSRLVWWPGASSGLGTPTDRPAVIAAALVAQGAEIIHLVDLDGAQQGRPVNLEAVGAVARAVATPLQVAGGIDGPEQVEIAFAAGATRVVMPMWAVAEDPELLAACLQVGGDWLAVGLDARPESLRGYPWRLRVAPRVEELVAELLAAGVRRFVLSHLADAPDDASASLVEYLSGTDAEILVAGGFASIVQLERMHAAGVHGVIIGEALFSGAISLPEAIQRVA